MGLTQSQPTPVPIKITKRQILTDKNDDAKLYNKEYNILIVGDRKVGKSVIVEQLTQGNKFRESAPYVKTLNIAKSKVAFDTQQDTNTNKFLVNISDVGDVEESDLIDDFNKTKYDACVIVFDIRDKISCDNTKYWYQFVKKTYPDIMIKFMCTHQDEISVNTNKYKYLPMDVIKSQGFYGFTPLDDHILFSMFESIIQN
jgi:GTPase SAR1 family protein